MEFIRAHQLSIMLYMSGICGILSYITLLTESLTLKRKSILSLMEFSAMLLLLFERASYLYRGDISDLGYFMVRICNGMVFFLSIFIPHLVTQYLKDLFKNVGKRESVPLPLTVCDFLFLTGTVFLVFSQFTGLYYTFDGQNMYHRASGYFLSYIMPILIVIFHEFAVFQYRALLEPSLVRSLMVSIALPTFFSFAQIFCYGVSLTSITMVIMVIIFYIFALKDLGRSIDQARKRELEFYKESEKKEAAMFEQTAQALSRAL